MPRIAQPAYLLTWNPVTGGAASRDKLASMTRGDAPFIPWSCGNTTSIPAGARVFLLRQGEHPRGVLASGWAVRGSHEAPHWREERRAAGDTAWVIDVAFDVLLLSEGEPPLDVMSIQDGGLANIPWGIPRSGIQLPEAAATALEAHWARHLGIVRPSTQSLDDPELAAVEGTIRERLVRHRSRERALRAAKLASARAADPEGRLLCEVPGCGFDFEARYGRLGAGFAHVHHLRPLATLDAPAPTTLDDLAVVCANCHAMIHRGGGCRPLTELIRD